MVVDIEGFTDGARTDSDRLMVRKGLYTALSEAFGDVQVDHQEDRGDGVLALVRPETPKSTFVDVIPYRLVQALVVHNKLHPRSQQIRLRMAVHAGEVTFDLNGIVATAVNTAFRLVEAQELREALRNSAGTTALIVSSWFFDEVVRNSTNSGSFRPARIQVKETDTTGWIHLPDAPYPASPTGPRQLPLAPAHFTGRVRELSFLHKNISQSRRPLYVITGPGGVGKTALALQWLHEIGDRFADGVLHADLGGRDPTEILSQLLSSLGIRTSATAETFRSATAGTSLAILLDNADAAAQVRELLPSSGLVVVTTRRKLAGLIVEGARFLSLAPLDQTASLDLLRKSVGEDRVHSEQGHAQALADLCAGLPLALSVIAARLAAHPHRTLGKVADDLRDQRTRLARLSVRDDFSVQAVVDVSYQELTPKAAQLFRSLGSHARPEFALGAAAATLGQNAGQASEAIEELLDANLLDEIGDHRFRMHELIHLYARERAEVDDSAEERDRSTVDIGEWYLYNAIAADTRLRKDRRRLPYGFRTVLDVQFGDKAEALDWLYGELLNIVATIRQALDAARFEFAWHLADALWPLRFRVDHMTNVLICRLGAKAANGWGNDFARARTQLRLGVVFMDTGEDQAARAHIQESLTLREHIGDVRGASNAREHLAVLALGSDPNEAARLLARVLAEKRSQGIPRRAGRTLLRLGRALLAAGDAKAAIGRLDEAADEFAAIPGADPYNETEVMIFRSQAYLADGQPRRALADATAALAKAMVLGAQFSTATAHERLGAIADATGDREAALREYRQSAEILDRLSTAEAERVRSQLRSL